MLTGTPVVAGDRLIVPISSIEEAAAMSKAYSCCTFRGSLAALDLKTGKLLWKTPMIAEPLKTIRDKDGGGKVQGPAGAAVWAAPTVDLQARPGLRGHRRQLHRRRRPRAPTPSSPWT